LKPKQYNKQVLLVATWQLVAVDCVLWLLIVFDDGRLLLMAWMIVCMAGEIAASMKQLPLIKQQTIT